MQGDFIREGLAVCFLVACPARGYMMSRDYSVVGAVFQASRLFSQFKQEVSFCRAFG